MTPEVVQQAGEIIDSFIAAIASLQEGMTLSLTVLAGFKSQVDAVKKAQAQIPAVSNRKQRREQEN